MPIHLPPHDCIPKSHDHGSTPVVHHTEEKKTGPLVPSHDTEKKKVPLVPSHDTEKKTIPLVPLQEFSVVVDKNKTLKIRKVGNASTGYDWVVNEKLTANKEDLYVHVSTGKSVTSHRDPKAPASPHLLGAPKPETFAIVAAANQEGNTNAEYAGHDENKRRSDNEGHANVGNKGHSGNEHHEGHAGKKDHADTEEGHRGHHGHHFASHGHHDNGKHDGHGGDHKTPSPILVGAPNFFDITVKPKKKGTWPVVLVYQREWEASDDLPKDPKDIFSFAVETPEDEDKPWCSVM